MKTKLLSFLILALAATAVQAQSLTGKTWGTTAPGEEDISVIMTFGKDGTCATSFTGVQEQDANGLKIVISIMGEIPGTYKNTGTALTMNFDSANASIELGIDFPDLDEKAASMLKTTLMKTLDKQKNVILNEIIKNLPKGTEFTIDELTSDTLILNNGKSTYTFTTVIR